MRYFVTGATGFIGWGVTRQLLAAGHEVVALARRPERAYGVAEAGARIVPGDIADPTAVRAAMDGADGVFHVAGWFEIGTRDPGEGWRANVEGARCVLEAMRDLGIPKGVYTSTISVFSDTHGRLVDERYRWNGRHLTAYDQTKWVAHYEVTMPLVREGLPLVIVQPGLVHGPGHHGLFADNLVSFLRGRLPLLPLGAAHCWSHVEDCARGHILAMEIGAPGESYIISGPPHTYLEAFQVVAEVSGRRPPPVHLYPGIVKAMAVLSDLADDLLPLPETFTGEGLRTTAGATYLASDAKARRELGFTTRPFGDGLRDTVLWEMQRLGMTEPQRH